MFEFEVYVRVSTDNQRDNGYSIDSQLRMIKEYSHTNIVYNKTEMCKYFYNLLKEINIEYRTTTVNFANYPYIMFAISKVVEMNSIEQNRVALYLFNSIYYKL